MDETQLAIENKGKGSGGGSRSQLIIAVVVLTLLSAICGWFLGGHIAKDYHKIHDGSAPGNVEESRIHLSNFMLDANIIKLPPIKTNIAQPASKRLRLEAALVLDKPTKLKDELAAEISSDFLFFLHSCTFDQLSGPSALFYLRSVLLDIAKIRSKGLVKAILISSLVLE